VPRLSVWVWGYLYWGAAWLLVGFLAAELAGEYRIAPWRTLSETTWHAERTYWFVSPLLFATFIGLSFHFFYKRDLAWSLGMGIVMSVAAHLLNKHLP
jgi:hypothetical protein